MVPGNTVAKDGAPIIKQHNKRYFHKMKIMICLPHFYSVIRSIRVVEFQLRNYIYVCEFKTPEHKWKQKNQNITYFR